MACCTCAACYVHAKGNLVNIPERRYFGGRLCGNATRLGHSWMGTEKSPLFFLTNSLASQKFLCGENGSSIRQSTFILSMFGHLITLLENPRVKLVYKFFRRAGVLKTASGFQGEKPLVHRRMWVKEFGKIDS
jgi:hypothetical protein